MITTARLNHLEEIRRRYLEGLPNEVEDEMVVDLFTMLGDMSLRNEILRAEIEDLKRELRLQTAARHQA